MTEPPEARFVILLPNLAGGGAERVALTLAGEFVRAGVAVELVLGQRRGELLGEVPAGVSVVGLGVGRLRRLVPALARYLRRASDRFGSTKKLRGPGWHITRVVMGRAAQ